MFNNLIAPAETSGTGFWRFLQPIYNLNCVSSSLEMTNTVLQKPCLQKEYYRDINMLMVQRMVGPHNFHLFTRFYKPLSMSYSFNLVYNIDDLMYSPEITKYNRGRRAYLGDETQKQLKIMLNESDFVFTTTDYIRDAYVKYYGVPKNKIICIPNFLPKWWIGDRFNPDKRLEEFKKNKNRLRIGIISSLSHYNLDKIRELPDGKAVYEEKEKGPDGKEVIVGYKDEDGNKISKEEGDKLPLVKDDLDIILDTIRNTANRYQWVIFGYKPDRLADLIKEKKVEYHGSSPIINYPSELQKLNLNIIVAPVVDNEFNRCKSNIKYLEACALGIPLLASDITAYSRYMPKEQLFKDGSDLRDKLDKFSYMSAAGYRNMIDRQWSFINSEHKECGLDCKSWWLEDNMQHWIKLFRMRKKAPILSFKNYLVERKKKEESDKKRKLSMKLLHKDGPVEIYG